ncbi:unnamed protein product, partial [Amoebophrya sp. A25]|eukprot:GSA25T00013707001.1
MEYVNDDELLRAAAELNSCGGLGELAENPALTAHDNNVGEAKPLSIEEMFDAGMVDLKTFIRVKKKRLKTVSSAPKKLTPVLPSKPSATAASSSSSTSSLVDAEPLVPTFSNPHPIFSDANVPGQLKPLIQEAFEATKTNKKIESALNLAANPSRFLAAFDSITRRAGQATEDARLKRYFQVMAVLGNHDDDCVTPIPLTKSRALKFLTALVGDSSGIATFSSADDYLYSVIGRLRCVRHGCALSEAD